MQQDDPPTLESPPAPPAPLSPQQQRQRRAEQRAAIKAGQQAGMLPTPTPTPAPLSAAPTPVAPPPPPTRTPGGITALLAQRAANAARQPAGKRFEADEVRRIPVEVTPAARALINASSHQGRLLPQALAEVLGEHPDLVGVRVDALAKAQHFAVHPDERDPLTGDEPALLRIEVTHASGDARLAHHWLINARALSDLHPQTHLPRFNAERAAREFLRLYRTYEQRHHEIA